jgi:mannosyltransferase
MMTECIFTPKRYLTSCCRLASQNNLSHALLVIIISGFLLRLSNLTESLWGDELWATHVYLGNLRTLVYTILYDPHPPLYSLFMFIWIKLFGDSELSVRLPPLICGVSSIFLVYTLAALTTDKKTALLASFLLSVSPVHIWYSQEARSYSALSFLLLLSIISYVHLRDSHARPIWIIVYFCAAFSYTLSHFYSSFYIILISLMCWLERHTQRRHILTLNLLIVSWLAVWLAIKFILPDMPLGLNYLRVFSFVDLWKLFFNWFLFGNAWNVNQYHLPILVIQVFFFAILFHGLVLLLKDTDKTKCSRDIVAYLFILPLILLGFGFIGYGTYIERSLFVALPFFFIVVAKGVTGFDGKVAKRTCIIIVILVNITTVVTYFSRDSERTVTQPKPDWRSVARYLDSELIGSSERASIFATDGAGTIALEYYEPRFKHVYSWGSSESGHKQLEKSVGILKLAREIYDRIIPPVNEECQDCFKIYGFRDVGGIYNQVASNNSTTLYLVRNKYSGEFAVRKFNRTIEALMKDFRVQYQTVQSFSKGIEIYKFNVKRPQLLIEQRSPIG